ncbi:MAG: hypothetical protein M0035_01265, partial [Actinomycetota bacterium]|nr:hypothetical protein [Actinomycetota bacterium]
MASLSGTWLPGCLPFATRTVALRASCVFGRGNTSRRSVAQGAVPGMLPPLFVMPVGTVTGVVGAGDTGDWVLLG